MKLISTVLLLLALSALSESVQHYYNSTVYRLRPSSLEQLDLLNSLDDEVDFWREPNRIHMIADVMLTPQNKDKVLKFFRDNSIQHEVFIPDVEQLIERERRDQARALLKTGLVDRQDNSRDTRDTEAIPNFWNSYQRLAQHQALVDALITQNPAIVSKVTIGTSYEGRTIIAAVIGVNSNAQKPVIYLEGGIHAREWISPATVTYFAQTLVNKFNANDATVVELLNYFDFYITPVLNVDGYEFTHTSTRLWRKTRRPNAGSTCIGADPNRNFGYQWGGPGASTNPCSETYRGDSAFSEPETKAESDYILNVLTGRVKAFLAVHSYSQLWLYPWSTSKTPAPDDAEINRVATIAVAALNQVSPTIRYTIGATSTVLYDAAGGAHDWAYASAGVTYSYTPELRDTGTYGFQLPAAQIIPSGQETSAAFIALAKAVKDKQTQ